MTITQSEVEAALLQRPGNRAFALALDKTADSAELLTLLTRYLHFNATFGACVANLAGRIGVQQELFRDPDEPIALLADRSMDVAADIFAAAIDEFGGGDAIGHRTHRMLALATLKATSRFFFGDDTALQSVTLNEATHRAVRDAQHGYTFTPNDGESVVFRGIGFHIGSEILADEEFRILNEFLRCRYPELVRHLETATVEMHGIPYPAYIWVQLHTTVEADHFAFALEGANRALAYYTGKRPPASVKEEILAGIGEFSAVQFALMEGLMVG